MQPKIKISVLKVFNPEEVFKENPPMKMVNPGPCPINKKGETFVRARLTLKNFDRFFQELFLEFLYIY